MDKIDRYGWTKLGKKGRAFDIDKNILQIDHSYQRGALIETTISGLAGDFDWSAFGALLVSKRKDGSFYVFDGQQRLLAALKRPDIGKLPCMVYEFDSIAEEALAFWSTNCRKAYVSAIDKFKSRLRGGAQPETEIQDWLTQFGLRVAAAPKDTKAIRFPRELLTTWGFDKEKTKEAVCIQLQIIDEDSLDVYIHKGIFRLLRQGFDLRQHTRKLQTCGKKQIIRAIRNTQLTMGKRNADSVVCATAILELIKRYRRTPLVVPELSRKAK